MRSLSERFNEKVDKTDGCWIWKAAKNERGYGVIGIGRKTRLAHRVSFELAGGDLTGMLVCHRCDNPSCVRPDHLFAGTDRDNVLDMIAKGRGRPPVKRGEDHPMARLKAWQVSHIRVARNYLGIPRASLAKAFKVSVSMITRVSCERNWK